jgi:hypothetical protein
VVVEGERPVAIVFALDIGNVRRSQVLATLIWGGCDQGRISKTTVVAEVQARAPTGRFVMVIETICPPTVRAYTEPTACRCPLR